MGVPSYRRDGYPGVGDPLPGDAYCLSALLQRGPEPHNPDGPLQPCEIEPEPRCLGTDLRGADLNWTDLSGAVLAMAGLADSYLSCADLTSADLSGADMGRRNNYKAAVL